MPGQKPRQSGPQSPLQTLSPEQFHENVSSVVQKATQRPFPMVEVRYRDLSISVNLAKRAKMPMPAGRVLPGGCSLKSMQFPEKKAILNNVSGVFRPGTITLVLGQPGSGKSSLMKILSGRFPVEKDVKVTGEIRFNAQKREDLLPRLPQFVAYVDQHDRHLPTLTVRETLEFAHECNGGGKLNEFELKMLNNGTPDDNQVAIELVEDLAKIMPRIILSQLGLNTCKDTIVGDAMRRGVSGGQRKRVTTGEMLFGRKNVLIMDEISTGLDSASTFDIIKTQRSVAKRLNKTIVIALLQPSPEVFDLFDEVLLMNEGEVIYHGPREEVLDYFKNLGLVCPPRRDIADFLLDIGTKEQLAYEVAGAEAAPISPQELGNAFRQSAIFYKTMELLNTPIPETLVKDSAEFMDGRKAFQQTVLQNFQTLVKREFLIASRNTTFIRARIFMVLLMGLLNGSTFYQIPASQTQIMMGTLFGAVMFLSMGQISELANFFAGRDVFYKQRGANFLRASTYTISFILSKMPMALMETIVFGTLVYWLCGLLAEAGAFCMFLFILFLVNMNFTSFFFLLSAVCRDMHIGKPLSVLCIGIFVLFAGFIVTKNHLPDYFIWMYWLDPIAWSIRALVVNQYRNKTFDVCDFEGVNYCNKTGMKMGEYALSLFAVPSEKFWVGAGIAFLIGMTLWNIFLATMALEYKRYETHASGGQTVTSTDVFDQIERMSIRESSSKILPVDDGEEAPTAVSTHKKYTVPPVTLAFKDLWYAVPNPSNKKETIDLLKGVTGYAAPGTMTALMGSSGAGKTTLMDVIAGRKTGGTIRGDILLNGHPATKQVIQRCTGYCEQTDIHSESATVREALTFSAFLRQPAEVSDKDKRATVKEVLDLLDLHPIADIQIHGRSTEQLKRITIAVELCAKPSVLFLDEPTSGLDARSAKAIMEGVRKVANSGRTIVCTIHQPSTEVFTLFDRLLLLKTGGQTVFHGNVGKDCVDLIAYFESLPGISKIPPCYNPSTWMLECIGAGVGNNIETDFAATYLASSLRAKVDEEMAKEGVSVPLPGTAPITFSKSYAASHVTQMTFVVKRFFTMYARTKSYTVVPAVIGVVLALIFGGIFVDSEYVSYQGVNSAVGMIFLASLFIGMVSFNGAIPMAAEERVSFYREQAAQMYHPFWYFVGSTVAELPFVIARTVLFVVIYYPFVGFSGNKSAVLFGLYLNLFVLMQTYLGQLFAYALPSVEIAALFGVLFNSVTSNYMGFNPPAAAIPKGYKWLYTIAPQRYALANLVGVVLTDCETPGGKNLGCQMVQGAPVELGSISVKGYVEYIFNMKYDQLDRNLWVLIGCIVGFRFLALLSLRFINHQKR